MALKQNALREEKESLYIRIGGDQSPPNLTVVNVHVPNARAPSFVKQILMALGPHEPWVLGRGLTSPGHLA